MAEHVIIEEQILDELSQQAQTPAYAKSSQELYAELAVPSESRSIRLLDLQAAPAGEDESPLVGYLRVALLQDRPAFTTLSYVWGPKISPGPKITSMPHGVDLKITASCFLALQHIRKQFGALTIWVDSICINQDDNDEKASQIPLMEDIYSSADVGYFWLGESNEATNFAIDILRSRAKFLGRLPLAYLTAPSKQQQKLELERFRERVWDDTICRLKSKRLRRLRPSIRGVHDSVRDPVWHTKEEELNLVQSILHHPWAYRTWTFQEIILSKNPVFVCGDNIILWEDIVNAVCVPDLSPGMATALAHWRSLVEVWFNFPRRPSQSQQQSNLDSQDDSHTFRKLLNTFWAEKGDSIPQITLLFHICCRIVVISPFLIVMGLLLSWFIMSEDNNTGILFPLGCLIYLSGFIWVVLFGMEIFVVFVIYTLFGMKQEWLLESNTKDNNSTIVELLNGIWTTLRKRESYEAYDKSFALSAILKRSGTLPSPPSYSFTIKETYWILFRDLLTWQPIAVTLILDAGVQNLEPGWPSWLPDWRTPEHNAWLVNRYRLGIAENAAPIGLTGPPTISRDSMSLRGQCIGTVTSYFRFSSITDKNNSSQLNSTLRELVQWMWAVKAGTLHWKSYNVMVSSLFAVIEGLSPQKRATTYLKRATPKKGSYWVVRSSWEAPYDYTDRQHDYQAFEIFCRIVFGGGVDTPAEAILAGIRKKNATLHCFARIVNKLVNERRCLFVLSTYHAGSGPLEMLTGDDVYLIPGVRAPVILRSQQHQGVFKFIGPVLVHGLMHGEEFKEEGLENLILE